MLTDRQNGGQNRDKAYFGSPVINTHSITPHWRRFPVAEKGLAGVWKSRNPESGNGTGIRNPEFRIRNRVNWGALKPVLDI